MSVYTAKIMSDVEIQSTTIMPLERHCHSPDVSLSHKSHRMIGISTHIRSAHFLCFSPNDTDESLRRTGIM